MIFFQKVSIGVETVTMHAWDPRFHPSVCVCNTHTHSCINTCAHNPLRYISTHSCPYAHIYTQPSHTCEPQTHIQPSHTYTHRPHTYTRIPKYRCTHNPLTSVHTHNLTYIYTHTTLHTHSLHTHTTPPIHTNHSYMHTTLSHICTHSCPHAHLHMYMQHSHTYNLHTTFDTYAHRSLIYTHILLYSDVHTILTHIHTHSHTYIYTHTYNLTHSHTPLSDTHKWIKILYKQMKRAKRTNF